MSTVSENNKKASKLPLGIAIVAVLMIVFGIAEIATGFTHHFFGLYTAEASAYTWAAVAIGGFYAAAGLLVLTMRKWAAALAIVLLAADIIGRSALVAVGQYPLDSPEQTFAIIAGTAIAAVFAIYIASRWGSYR